ncbi:UNVERIFIED_CONTAM: hypothetical protein Sradi_7008400 [Sesamum radiatum]|uniref:Uncharacterized protein n=1 Tax=Sesamum radiatum TaxID=300843 RepID=A0AAW2JCK7_SESRA
MLLTTIAATKTEARRHRKTAQTTGYGGPTAPQRSQGRTHARPAVSFRVQVSRSHAKSRVPQSRVPAWRASWSKEAKRTVIERDPLRKRWYSIDAMRRRE